MEGFKRPQPGNTGLFYFKEGLQILLLWDLGEEASDFLYTFVN